jgi:phenylacetate-CoA ligase
VRAPTRHYFEKRFETMDPVALRALQWRLLSEQMERAAETPFYRRKFQVAGFQPSMLRSEDDLARVPLTTKEELCRDIEEVPPYGSRLRVPSDRIVDVVETSGTSGLGKEVHVLSASDRRRTFRMEAFGFVWAGIRRGSVVALTLPVAMTAAGNWWLMTLDRLQATCLRLGNMEVEAKLDYLQRYRPDILVATPAYVSRMERVALDRGLNIAGDLPGLRSVLVSGEAKSGEWAANRSRAWGAEVYEQWGCCAGAVTWSCEGGMVDSDSRLRLMHCQPHLTYLEVIDPVTGHHVADGDHGEVVITPLGTEASPLLRFATGDRARYLSSRHCDCGRPFPGLEAASVSRYDDMVKVKGVNVWPSTVASLLEQYVEVIEHLVTVYSDRSGREQVKLDAVVSAGTPLDRSRDLAAALRSRLKSDVGLNFEIEIQDESESALAGEVLKAGSGKVRRWRDLRGTAD